MHKKQKLKKKLSRFTKQLLIAYLVPINTHK